MDLGKLIQPFLNVAPFIPTPRASAPQALSQVSEFAVGIGSKVFRSDKQGMWLGGNKFTAAPFKVDMFGNANATSMTIGGYIPTGGAAGDVNTNAVTIDGGKLTAGTVTADRILANSLTATQIAAGAIGADEIQAGAVIAGKIAANAISANEIQAGAITAGKVAANAISANEIQAGAVTALKISVANLAAISANLGTVTAGTINGNTINAGGSYSGGINVYGNALIMYNTSAGEGGRVFGSGSNLRIEAQGQIEASKRIAFDNTSGTGFFVPGCVDATRNSKMFMYDNIDMNEKTIDACDTVWAYNFNSRSDKKLKRKINKVSSTLDKVLKLNPVSYEFKKDQEGGITHFGLIAQDVRELFPEIVRSDKDGLLNINYIELIPILITAIKELKGSVNASK